MKNLNEHLEDDLLIRFIVDEKEMAAEGAAHLNKCKVCSEKKIALESRLLRLGEMADSLAPLPLKKVALSKEDDRGSNFLNWKHSLALAVSAVLVISSLWFAMPESGKAPPSAEELALEETNKELLMAEVMALEESALPDLYIYIAGESDDSEYDSFIDYVFPSENGVNDA